MVRLHATAATSSSTAARRMPKTETARWRACAGGGQPVAPLSAGACADPKPARKTPAGKYVLRVAILLGPTPRAPRRDSSRAPLTRVVAAFLLLLLLEELFTHRPPWLVCLFTQSFVFASVPLVDTHLAPSLGCTTDAGVFDTHALRSFGAAAACRDTPVCHTKSARQFMCVVAIVVTDDTESATASRTMGWLPQLLYHTGDRRI